MTNIRVIARLDIKGANLIKGIQLEGLRVLGDPNHYANNYYQQGADELIYIDAVASLYGRNSIVDTVKSTASNIFIPLTVGGGIRSISDVRSLLCAGADKIAVNTAAIKRPELITEIAEQFGSQCMVLSVEAKNRRDFWEVYCDNGREPTGINVFEWVEQATELGAGEILLTSVDKEGTREGFDIDLVRNVTKRTTVPVIASGGFGHPNDLINVVNEGFADGVAIADALHYQRFSLAQIKSSAINAGIQIRIA